MSLPDLKLIDDLTGEDLARHPVWVICDERDGEHCHWEAGDDDMTHPWTGPLPVTERLVTLIVRAVFTFADETQLTGWTLARPSRGADADRHVFYLNPHLLMPSRRYQPFADVGCVRSAEGRASFYWAVGKHASEIFPIRFRGEAGLTTQNCDGTIRGFCWWSEKAPNGIEIVI